jgi:hypothetical protein
MKRCGRRRVEAIMGHFKVLPQNFLGNTKNKIK